MPDDGERAGEGDAPGVPTPAACGGRFGLDMPQFFYDLLGSFAITQMA